MVGRVPDYEFQILKLRTEVQNTEYVENKYVENCPLCGQPRRVHCRSVHALKSKFGCNFQMISPCYILE